LVVAADTRLVGSFFAAIFGRAAFLNEVDFVACMAYVVAEQMGGSL
jgi:hypothetical protein